MRSARLLTVALLLSSTWVLAQENQRKMGQGTDDSSITAASPTAMDPLLRLQKTQPRAFDLDPSAPFKDDSSHNQRTLAIAPGLIPGDAVCLKIRSYLMARDSRGSDSTHLVGYSTCQPASRYRLRTAVGSTQTERSR